jgi:hypothetical protein
VVTAALVGAAMGSASLARADGAPAARDGQAAARALFEEGVRHADHARWSEAADRFARAYALKPTPEIAYNLSAVLIEQRRLTTAGELLRRVIDDEQAPGEVRAAARARLAQVEPRFASLTIRLRAGAWHAAPPTLDGHPIEAAHVGAPIAVDPGVHRVELQRPGALTTCRFVSVPEGGSAVVELGDPAPVAPAAVAVTAPAAGASPARRRWRWVIAGVLVAGVAAGMAAALAHPSAPSGNVDTWRVRQ